MSTGLCCLFFLIDSFNCLLRGFQSWQNPHPHYALKTIFPEVMLLGLRELIFLRYLSSKIPHQSQFCILPSSLCVAHSHSSHTSPGCLCIEWTTVSRLQLLRRNFDELPLKISTFLWNKRRDCDTVALLSFQNHSSSKVFPPPPSLHALTHLLDQRD